MRTSEVLARGLVAYDGADDDVIVVTVSVLKNMGADILDAIQRQREIDAACATLEALPLKGRAA